VESRSVRALAAGATMDDGVGLVGTVGLGSSGSRDLESRDDLRRRLPLLCRRAA
jgi:hypothetical protein